MSETLAYLAGLFDAEGCVGLHLAGNKKRPSLAITMTDEQCLAKFATTFNINYHSLKVVNPKWKPQWGVNTKNRRVLEIIKQLYPWLVIKQEAAKLIFDYYKESAPEKSNDFKLAYFAGLMDGDGGIYLYTTSRGKVPLVKLELTHEPGVFNFAGFFGGHVRLCKGKYLKNPNWSPKYVCLFQNRDAYRVAKQLRDKLILKQPAADILIAHYEDFSCLRCQRPFERKSNNRKLCDECIPLRQKELKLKRKLLSKSAKEPL